MNKTIKSLNELEKSLRFKKFYGNINTVDYEDLDSYDYNYDFADDDEYRKTGSTRTLFKELDIDYYKPIRTNSGFAERNDNYIEYTSNADRYENLSPKEYLNVIRPYLKDLINEHKPIMESNTNNNTNDNSNNNKSNNNSNNDTTTNNNNSNNNDTTNNNSNSNNSNSNRAEWKIQLIIKIILFLLKILKILTLHIQQVNQ